MITVAELIEELKKVPDQSLPVYIDGAREGGECTIGEIEIHEKRIWHDNFFDPKRLCLAEWIFTKPEPEHAKLKLEGKP